VKKLLALLAALAFAVTLGCGGADDGRMTKGEACSQLSAPICTRMVACEIVQSQATCEAAAQHSCCEDDDTCSQLPESQEAEDALRAVIQACSAAIPAWSCEQLARRVLPEQCTG
jgi:hypothetical protein